MMCDFQKTFNPTLEDRQKTTINYLRMIEKLVTNRNCVTCKYSHEIPTKMHSYDTVDLFCTKKNAITFENCSDWDLAPMQIDFRGEAIR